MVKFWTVLGTRSVKAQRRMEVNFLAFLTWAPSGSHRWASRSGPIIPVCWIAVRMRSKCAVTKADIITLPEMGTPVAQPVHSHFANWAIPVVHSLGWYCSKFKQCPTDRKFLINSKSCRMLDILCAVERSATGIRTNMTNRGNSAFSLICALCIMLLSNFINTHKFVPTYKSLIQNNKEFTESLIFMYRIMWIFY
jgi:hypothetical protein